MTMRQKKSDAQLASEVNDCRKIVLIS